MGKWKYTSWQPWNALSCTLRNYFLSPLKGLRLESGLLVKSAINRLVSMYRQICYLYMVWYQGTARSGFYGIRETQLRYLVVSRYSMIWFLLYKRDLVTVSCGIIASHADVLRGSSHVPAPWTSADLSGKNVDQSQQTSRSGKCTLDLEKFRAWLYSSRKDQKGLMKGEDLTVLEQTTQLTHKRSY